MDNQKRAKVLIQAMPYIKKWTGETIVVKYGGNAMLNDKLKSAVMSDLVLMQLVGHQCCAGTRRRPRDQRHA